MRNFYCNMNELISFFPQYSFQGGIPESSSFQVIDCEYVVDHRNLITDLRTRRTSIVCKKNAEHEAFNGKYWDADLDWHFMDCIRDNYQSPLFLVDDGNKWITRYILSTSISYDSFKKHFDLKKKKFLFWNYLWPTVSCVWYDFIS